MLKIRTEERGAEGKVCDPDAGPELLLGPRLRHPLPMTSKIRVIQLEALMQFRANPARTFLTDVALCPEFAGSRNQICKYAKHVTCFHSTVIRRKTTAFGSHSSLSQTLCCCSPAPATSYPPNRLPPTSPGHEKNVLLSPNTFKYLMPAIIYSYPWKHFFFFFK